MTSQGEPVGKPEDAHQGAPRAVPSHIASPTEIPQRQWPGELQLGPAVHGAPLNQMEGDLSSLAILNPSGLTSQALALVGSEAPQKHHTASNGESVATTSAIAKATEARMMKFRKKLPESCEKRKLQNLEMEKNPDFPNYPAYHPLYQGEVEFTGLGGHRAFYVICSHLQEEPDEILRWMFTASAGWRMKPPNLILFSYGGRDHYVNWSSSETLRNRKAWGCETEVAVGIASEQVPLKSTSRNAEAKFHQKFRGRLGEIAGGVCQAVLECGGWFDFGHGHRGGMGEVLKDGLKVYWSAYGCLAGHKEDSVVFAVRDLDDTEFGEEFYACARPTVPDPDCTVLPKLDKRVLYPSVDSVIFPEIVENFGATDDLDDLDEEDDFEVSKSKRQDGTASRAESTAKFHNEVKFKVTSRFLINALTHIVFIQNKQCKDRLRYHLKDLATRAIICANGNPALIQPGVDGKILSEAMAGVPIICLHHTGGAAEMLGSAVNHRRQHFDDGETERDESSDYNLPENVPDDHILILNPAKDTVEKVINKLTLVLSTVTDKEMMEVGYQKGERSRLRYAWELFTLFQSNAERQSFRARVLFYSMVVLSMLVTLLALLYTEKEDIELVEDSESDDDFAKSLYEARGFIKVTLLLLPILNGFLMTMASRFNPIGKWAHLESGAVMIKSEIYMYRCRVKHYIPRQGANLNIEEKVESMCSYSAQEGASQAQGSSMTNRKKKAEKQPREMSRRGTFATAIEAINSETIGSDLRGDSLKKPSAQALTHTLEALYDSKSVRERHDQHERTCLDKLCCCCKRRDDNKDVVASRMAEENRKEWTKAFSEFRSNPNVIDDEFLRDDGFSLITAEDYVHFRLLPLIQAYNRRSSKLSIWTHVVQSGSFFFTASLTACYAVGLGRWVPLGVAFITAFSNIDELEHFTGRLRNVNQSLEALKNLHFWWQSLSMVERRLPANKEILVAGTEATVDAEVSTYKKSLRTMTSLTKAGGEDEEEDDRGDAQ